MIWKPNVTVAAVIERDGRFLMIEEHTDEGLRINQPAGHIEKNETLPEGCAREALEESGHIFVPKFLIGVYQWTRPAEVTYIRFAFGGELTGYDEKRSLDEGIVRSLWLSPAELREILPTHRSPLVMQCVDDYMLGKRFPLNLICSYPCNSV